jgi:uncharacterized secreted protein with C-terminal beta-propeller domain
MTGGSWSRRKVAAVLVVLALVALVAVGLYRSVPQPSVPRQLTIPERDCGPLQHFESLEALKAHLKESPQGWPWIFGDARLLGAGDVATAGSVPYSGTNNQVAGVDEADIVKTDGTYIYTATWNASSYGSEIAIVRAYPPETAALVSRIPVDPGVQGLFVQGDRLAVISGGGYGYVLERGPMPWFYRPQTRLLVFDVSDPASPALVKNVTVSGSYVGARLIGTVTTLVVQDYLYLVDNGTSVVLPTIWTDGVPRDLTYADLGYFADSEGSNAKTIVLSVDLATSAPPAFETFLTRGVYQLYVSAANLYLAGVEWEANPDRTLVAETSTVHKVSIDGGPHYVCSVRVPGTILNQFSMDEASTILRVATTLGQWTPEGRATSAAVFTFDDLLNPLGSLTGLAEGERIFSARFLGGRAYLVTYRQVDPLFVLDVSDPRAPAVLGFLKIPGVSDYLHPLDETHLIGLGRDDPAGTGRLQGLKLSLFDVADVEHPVEVSSFVVGSAEGEWAWSEAQYDHKAFLLVPDPALVVIPVTIYRWDGTSSSYWQGAYAVEVSAQGGFRLRGTITHSDSADGSMYWLREVRRSLYIGEFLYTVSSTLILGNRLDSLAEVARVPL